MRRSSLPWVALLLTCSGCASRCSSSGATADAAPPSDRAHSDLLEPGKAPLQTLQIGRWTGLRYHLTVTNESTFGVEGQAPVRAPTSIARLGFVVERGTADPLVKIVDGRELKLVEEVATLESVEIKASDIPAHVLLDMYQRVKPFFGSSTRALIGEDGEVAELKTETLGRERPPEDIAQLLDDAWDTQRRFPFRLPPAPLGVGGKWRFSDPVKLRGVRAIQVADMTLVSADDQRIKLRLRLRVESPRQEIPHPLKPAETAMLETCRGDGDGELTMDRLTGVLLDARMTTTARLKVSAEGGQKSITFVSASTVGAKGEIDAPDAGGGDR